MAPSFQQVEDPQGLGLDGGRHAGRVRLPPVAPRALRDRGELALGLVEDRGGVVAGEPGPAGDGVEEVGQQRRDGGGAAAGQQPGRFHVAPACADGSDEGVGEIGASTRDDGTRQLAPYDGGGVVHRRDHGGVGYAAPPDGGDGTVPDDRIGIGEARLQPGEVAAGLGRQRREPPLVRPAPRQLGHERAQLPAAAQFPGPDGGEGEASGVRHRVGDGEQVVDERDRRLRRLVDHAEDSCRRFRFRPNPFREAEDGPHI